jgi:hypothetical protein
MTTRFALAFSQLLKYFVPALIAIASATAVSAVGLPIASYSMENGQSGSQTYYDDTYGGLGATGNPGVAGSPLSGGLGQLTDGVFADDTDIFDDDWVGWFSIQPTITIDLGTPRSVDFASVHASNWSPPFNDVGAPGSAILSISLDNVTYTPLGPYVMLPEHVSGDESRWIDFPFGGFTARYVRFQLNDGTKLAGTSPGPKPWIFLDEIRVDGEIPEPTSAAFAIAVILAATTLGRRR